MVRTVVIDDEPRNIKLISGMIREHCPGIEIIGSTDDLMEVQPIIHSLKPSLVLLDIEFPSGTIFPVLDKLIFTDFHIIFITAHNTYATEAFKQNAVDYILKPVTPEALVQSIKKAEAKIRDNIATDISNLLGKLKSGLRQSKKIPLPAAEGILFINEADIIRCEASGRYTVLYLVSGKNLTVTRTLKEIESLLDAKQFFRVHHSHIINLEMIKKYHRGQGGTAELTDGSLVEVSSSRKNELLDILLNRQGH